MKYAFFFINRLLRCSPSELSEGLFDQFVINKSSPSPRKVRLLGRGNQQVVMMYMTSKAGSFLNGSVILLDGGKQRPFLVRT
jgi:hypothetical protein